MRSINALALLHFVVRWIFRLRSFEDFVLGVSVGFRLGSFWFSLVSVGSELV